MLISTAINALALMDAEPSAKTQDGERPMLVSIISLCGIRPASRYRPRSLGSNTSLSASPNRLKPSTTMNMHKPGNIATQGAV